MSYFAYLDESGHIGPYLSRQDPTHNNSPVFGLAGLVLLSECAEGERSLPTRLGIRDRAAPTRSNSTWEAHRPARLQIFWHR